MSKLRLIVDTHHHVDALRCLLVATATKTQLDVSRIPGTRRSQLQGGEGTSSTSVNVTSSYAICRYLINTASADTNSCYGGLCSARNRWEEDNTIFWAIGGLRSALSSVKTKEVSAALDHLSSALGKPDCCLLNAQGRAPSLSDVFIWTAIRLSKVYTLLTADRGGCPVFERYNVLRDYCARMEEALLVKETLKVYFEGRLPEVCSSPVKATDPKDLFYLTTAINYTNGLPHIGHAYEIVVSDVLARYHRMFGRDTFFLTGTDEHGQKIAATAAGQGKKPIEICDFYAQKFVDLDIMLNTTYNAFGRTTTEVHKKTAQHLWKLAKEKGDIYLGKYVGWYNVREEVFVTERDAEASDFKDPISGIPLQKVEETSYFFRMSAYQQRLLKHIAEHPEFIQPDYRRNEILARLSEPLEDLSCSRTTFTWGVPVPDDSRHVMYVWFDALVNYLTGIGYTINAPEARFWPANAHIIGKDITWFHCVIWPCILMSVGIPLPKTVFAHGFVVAGDGRKMSKSLGNVIDPVAVVNQWDNNPDPFRFFILKSTELGRDLRFDLSALTDMYNSDLADTIGNLVHRATSLCKKFCDGQVVACEPPAGSPPFDFDLLRYRVEELIANFALQETLEVVMGAFRDTNKYLTEKAPWAIKDAEERKAVCRIVLEAVFYLAHFLEPYVPRAAHEIFKRLNTEPREIRSLSAWYNNLVPGTPVTIGEVLFVKKETVSGAGSTK